MTLLRGTRAAAPRTLVDIFRETVRGFGDHPALDNGVDVLTYAELAEAADAVADGLSAMGVGRGDRVGVRIRSGTTELYTSILGVLVSGAAYVPVDADDPDERVRTVFREAGVAAIIGDELDIAPSAARASGAPGAPGAPGDREPREPTEPRPSDDAWIIFTSGSTGLPKGVAVSHRSAAGFVDAESRLFLQDRPIGVGDRVMAGLSVAFDASCEEADGIEGVGGPEGHQGGHGRDHGDAVGHEPRAEVHPAAHQRPRRRHQARAVAPGQPHLLA